jgi:Domain of unknown function (DUF1841)
MLFTQDRETIRKFFAETWHKAQIRLPLEPMEAIAADIIGQHPEFHELLIDPDALQRDYQADLGEGNPFLHLSLHVAVHEQVSTDRPAGVRAAYQFLLGKLQNIHEVQHRMMECLLESLWQAVQENRAPNEASYLECLRGHGRRAR